MPYYSSDDEADPAAYLAGLQGNYVADEQADEIVAESDEVVAQTVETESVQDVADSGLSAELDGGSDSEIAQ
jgi:hypothetical protein